MFQIEQMTEATLATFTKRVERHGDDEKAAISVGLQIRAENFLLDQIDPALRQALYKPKDEAQEGLPEVAESTPVLRCNSIDSVALPTKLEGWTLAVDDGLDGTEPMLFGGCKVDKFNVEPIQGGSIILSTPSAWASWRCITGRRYG